MIDSKLLFNNIFYGFYKLKPKNDAFHQGQELNLNSGVKMIQNRCREVKLMILNYGMNEQNYRLRISRVILSRMGSFEFLISKLVEHVTLR